MLNWLKLVVLVVLGGCCSDQPVTNCNQLKTVTNHHELDNALYDAWSKPKGKKLFEIKIK